MRPDTITLAIFEKFKPEELAETAQKLVQALSDKETAETEKKTSDAVFNERIKKHEADAAALAKQYTKGGETAQIGCKIRYDIPVAGKKSYIRMDSEETVEVHDMSLEEKQETLQFPLAASSEAKPGPEPKPKKERLKPLPPTSPAEITFKDIQSIAAHMTKLPAEDRASAMLEMQKHIAEKLLAQKTIIGPEGNVEAVESLDAALKLVGSYLELAIAHESATPALCQEEVTRLCPYPGCILFVDHDGDHDVRANEQPKVPKASAPEAQPQKEEKPKRKKRGFAPPPSDEPPAHGANDPEAHS